MNELVPGRSPSDASGRGSGGGASTEPSILQAIDTVWQPWFRDSESWAPWRTFLKGVFGLEMDDADRQVFERHTGRTVGLSRRLPRSMGQSRQAQWQITDRRHDRRVPGLLPRLDRFHCPR